MGRDPSSTATVEGSPAPPLRPTDLPPNDGEPPKKEISDTMKDRLTRELESQGANPNKSAGNPILLVAAVVGLLVIIGGKGEVPHRRGFIRGHRVNFCSSNLEMFPPCI